MNTIIIENESKYKEILNYEGAMDFVNFIFNDFKVVCNRDEHKDVYLVHLNNGVTKITKHIYMNGKQKTIKFSYEINEENGFEFVEKPTGDYVTQVCALHKAGRFDYNDLIRDLSQNELELTMVLCDAKFIESLRSYIMNESYNRKINKKISKTNKETVDENSNKNISNKKSKKKKDDTVVYLLEDIIEYIGGRRKTGFHCSCECWSVRGHFRHYKNGNIKWINSYEKGTKRNTGCELGTKVYSV